jgi:hypothetical protein
MSDPNQAGTPNWGPPYPAGASNQPTMPMGINPQSSASGPNQSVLTWENTPKNPHMSAVPMIKLVELKQQVERHAEIVEALALPEPTLEDYQHRDSESTRAMLAAYRITLYTKLSLAESKRIAAIFTERNAVSAATAFGDLDAAKAAREQKRIVMEGLDKEIKRLRSSMIENDVKSKD